MDEIISRLKAMKDDIAAGKGVRCIDDINSLIKLCEKKKNFEEAEHIAGQADLLSVDEETGSNGDVIISANECHIYFYKNIYASDLTEEKNNPPAKE